MALEVAVALASRLLAAAGLWLSPWLVLMAEACWAGLWVQPRVCVVTFALG